MARPPDEDPPQLEGILDEVRDALDEAGIAGADVRDALLDGVREALGELGVEGGPPGMTVVDGGRSAGEPRADGPPPPLTIASDAAEDGVSRIKVFVTKEQREPKADGVRDGRGGIALSGGGMQTVFHGAIARAYRLHCELGVMRVSLDGKPAETLLVGQSLDVEAQLIRLLADGDAGGWYKRL